MDVHNMMNILQKAQDTYGYPNQVSVAMEELAELIAALAKYPRFPDHTTAMEDKKFRDHVIEEVADVHVVIQHLYMIFRLDPKEVEDVMDMKLRRLDRWIKASPDFSHTMKDRELDIIIRCKTCSHSRNLIGFGLGKYCDDCNPPVYENWEKAVE